MSQKIRLELDNAMKNLTLLNTMIGSGQFGRGIGKNKLEDIMNNYPDILNIYHNKGSETVKELIMKLDGFNEKTTEQFVSNISNFLQFTEDLSLIHI